MEIKHFSSTKNASKPKKAIKFYSSSSCGFDKIPKKYSTAYIFDKKEIVAACTEKYNFYSFHIFTITKEDPKKFDLVVSIISIHINKKKSYQIICFSKLFPVYQLRVMSNNSNNIVCGVK
jgi:hypothetical protein